MNGQRVWNCELHIDPYLVENTGSLLTQILAYWKMKRHSEPPEPVALPKFPESDSLIL